MGAIFTSRRMVLAGVALLALLAGLSLHRSLPEARAAGACDVTDSSLDAEETGFLQMINTYRQQNGLKPLRISATLNRSSMWMAVDLARNRYFAHTDSLGRGPSQRAQACGYPDQAGENLAAGTDWESADHAMGAWKSSPGHDTNMKTAYYTVIGIARYYDANSPYGWYWVTDFGIADDSGAPAPAPPAPSPKPAPAPPTPAPTRPPAIIQLSPGANLVSWPGPDYSPAAMSNASAAIDIIYSYDAATGTWQRYGRGLPAQANTLTVLEAGHAYWVMARQAAQVSVAP